MKQDLVKDHFEYLATHFIILSSYIKDTILEKDQLKLIEQYLDEMSENLKQIVSIINKDEVGNKLNAYTKFLGESNTKIIRDFKIDKVMNERNR